MALTSFAGETVVEVMSTHGDGMGADQPPPLPPCFHLKHPASSQAVALARSMAQKGALFAFIWCLSVEWESLLTQLMTRVADRCLANVCVRWSRAQYGGRLAVHDPVGSHRDRLCGGDGVVGDVVAA